MQARDAIRVAAEAVLVAGGCTMNQSDNPNERRKEVVLADGKTYIEVSTLRHYWLFDRYEKIEPDQSAAANSDS